MPAPRPVPPAARVILAEAIADSRRSGITDPTITALMVAEALIAAGWTIAPNGAQRAA